VPGPGMGIACQFPVARYHLLGRLAAVAFQGAGLGTLIPVARLTPSLPAQASHLVGSP